MILHSEQTDLNAAKLSGKEASRAWRDLRLQWLRVQESFFQAELAGIESRIPAIQQRSRLGYGGGNALQHMQARKRQLEWKLLSIQVCFLSMILARVLKRVNG